MPTLLRAHGLTKRYGDTFALNAVDFEVTDGVTGLLGSNGAGKSTAIKLFAGLILPTSGSVEVFGENPSESVEVRSIMGYMPEQDCTALNVTASDFLTHMAGVSGLPQSKARSRAADTLRHVGLFEERYRPMSEYSTGMKQRVKFAQAIVHDPKLVLMDEPTAGLDPTGREEMLDLIRLTAHKFGINLLISSHLMGDVERTADRVIVLEGGRVVKHGEIPKLTQENQSLYLEVDANRNHLRDSLFRRGIDNVLEGRVIVITEVTDDDYDAIRDALVESEAPLRRMVPGRQALTEIFREKQH